MFTRDSGESSRPNHESLVKRGPLKYGVSLPLTLGLVQMAMRALGLEFSLSGGWKVRTSYWACPRSQGLPVLCGQGLSHSPPSPGHSLEPTPPSLTGLHCWGGEVGCSPGEPSPFPVLLRLWRTRERPSLAALGVSSSGGAQNLQPPHGLPLPTLGVPQSCETPEMGAQGSGGDGGEDNRSVRSEALRISQLF